MGEEQKSLQIQIARGCRSRWKASRRTRMPLEYVRVQPAAEMVDPLLLKRVCTHVRENYYPSSAIIVHVQKMHEISDQQQNP